MPGKLTVKEGKLVVRDGKLVVDGEPNCTPPIDPCDEDTEPTEGGCGCFGGKATIKMEVAVPGYPFSQAGEADPDKNIPAIDDTNVFNALAADWAIGPTLGCGLIERTPEQWSDGHGFIFYLKREVFVTPDGPNLSWSFAIGVWVRTNTGTPPGPAPGSEFGYTVYGRGWTWGTITYTGLPGSVASPIAFDAYTLPIPVSPEAVPIFHVYGNHGEFAVSDTAMMSFTEWEGCCQQAKWKTVWNGATYSDPELIYQKSLTAGRTQDWTKAECESSNCNCVYYAWTVENCSYPLGTTPPAATPPAVPSSPPADCISNQVARFVYTQAWDWITCTWAVEVVPYPPDLSSPGTSSTEWEYGGADGSTEVFTWINYGETPECASTIDDAVDLDPPTPRSGDAPTGTGRTQKTIYEQTHTDDGDVWGERTVFSVTAAAICTPSTGWFEFSSVDGVTTYRWITCGCGVDPPEPQPTPEGCNCEDGDCVDTITQITVTTTDAGDANGTQIATKDSEQEWYAEEERWVDEEHTIETHRRYVLIYCYDSSDGIPGHKSWFIEVGTISPGKYYTFEAPCGPCPDAGATWTYVPSQSNPAAGVTAPLISVSIP